MASSDYQFGSFLGCDRFAYPVCIMFDKVPRRCSGAALFTNNANAGSILDIIVSAAAVLMAVFLTRRAYKKLAGVGSKEMCIFLALFAAASVLEVFTGGNFITDASAMRVRAHVRALHDPHIWMRPPART